MMKGWGTILIASGVVFDIDINNLACRKLSLISHDQTLTLYGRFVSYNKGADNWLAEYI